MDVDRLKQSWAQVVTYGDEVPLRFYSRLFVIAPEAREMFPMSMTGQRERLVTALGHTVSHVDDFETLAPYLAQLGRDHRKFGVTPEHYVAVGEALLATLSDFLGESWVPELSEDWSTAYGLVAQTMIEAAEQAALSRPPWWSAEVVAHEQRTFDIAVLTIQPDQPYMYVPGQSIAVEAPERPRMWRFFSPANAPRHDGSIDLHVRRVPGGQVSGTLVDHVQKGDTLRLGSPIGYQLTLPPNGERDVLLIAGGTGLAPLKALVEQTDWQVNLGETSRNVTLFVGARTARELYDLDALRALEAESLWFTVVAALSGDPLCWDDEGWLAEAGPIEHGHVGAVALSYGSWQDHDIYVCGSNAMVVATVQQLRKAGCPPEQIHFEGFQTFGGDVHGVIDPGGRNQQ